MLALQASFLRSLPLLGTCALGLGTLPATVQAPASAPAPAAAASGLAGEWRVTPLLKVGDPIPGPGGRLLELGEAFALEQGAVAAWGRTAEPVHGLIRSTSPWNLYALRDGQVSLVLESGKPFLDPEAKRTWIIRLQDGAYSGSGKPTVMAAGRRMLHWSASTRLRADLDAVYGWDGVRIARLLGPGDALTSANGRAVSFGKGQLEGVTRTGLARVAFWADRPSGASGTLLLDGGKSVACWLDDETPPASAGREPADLAAWSALVKAMPPASGGARPSLEAVAYLRAEGGRALVSGTTESPQGRGTALRETRLWLAEGARLVAVPPPPGFGGIAGLPGVQDPRAALRLRTVPGLGGVVVQTPGRAELYLPPDGADPILVAPPRINTGPLHFFTVADIVGWVGPDQIVVRDGRGVYRLDRK